MIVDTNLLPIGSKARPGKRLERVDSITIHWIGPYPKQSVLDPRQWWLVGSDGKGVEASAHYILKNKYCIQTIPLEEVAWHCGSKGNFTSIGIEVVPEDKAGVFSQQSIDSLKLLIKEVRRQVGEVPLKRHYDWTKKDCPRWYTPLVTDGDEHWKNLLEYING